MIVNPLSISPGILLNPHLCSEMALGFPKNYTRETVTFGLQILQKNPDK
jgi:hypothetical protein